MLPFRRFYGFESWLNHDADADADADAGYLPEEPSSLIKTTDDQMDSGRSKLERKSTEACKSHRDAERRRRQRINAHLSTLRSLLPNAAKSDKASLLAEVVQYVKQLREQADDVVGRHDGDLSCGSGAEACSEKFAYGEAWPFPGESDEVTLSYCNGDDGGEAKLMKATLCCEDRPSLNRDLTQAIRSVRAKAVRAEMMTVGGRTKSVVMMRWNGGGDGAEGRGEEARALERALKAVIENRALVGSGMDPVVLGQKRARDSYGSRSEGGCAFLSGSADM